LISSRTSHSLGFFYLVLGLLPWRGDSINGARAITPTPYGVMISEIMLQQTRVETVISYWQNWMSRFPTVEALAEASLDEVNSAWSGLGYYRRAKQLAEAAKIIARDRAGIVPSELPKLLDLPGIGPYTAGAIASIAYNQAECAVDGNVIRVLSRLRAINQLDGKPLEKKCRELATSLVDPHSPGAFNQALMELGATVCKPSNPTCESDVNQMNDTKSSFMTCPLKSVCAAYRLMVQSHGPVQPDIGTQNTPDIEDLVTGERCDGQQERQEQEMQEPLSLSVRIMVTDFPRKVPKKPPVEKRFIVIALCIRGAVYCYFLSPFLPPSVFLDACICIHV
jgi:A/G-specific adenine glycosylase